MSDKQPIQQDVENQGMTNTIAELLKDSAYKLIQFKPEQIQALEAGISLKDTAKKPAPYVTCLVRGKSPGFAEALHAAHEEWPMAATARSR